MAVNNDSGSVEVPKAAPKRSPVKQGPAGSTEAPKPLDATWSRLAALASLALTAILLVAVIATMATAPSGDEGLSSLTGILVFKIVILVILAGVGLMLLMGQAWAQQVLLAVWLLVGAYSAVALLVFNLWGAPALWEAIADPWAYWVILVSVLLVSQPVSVLLVKASACKSRMRYASMVAVSVVSAATVAVGLNATCQVPAEDGGFGWRKDIESLGKYGISERTTKIVSPLANAKITCVYLPALDMKPDDPKAANPHHDEIWDYLEGLKKAMEREGKTIDIADVATRPEQTALLLRMRDRHRAVQEAHISLLEKEFLPNSAKMIADIRSAETDWGEMPDNAFMTRFGLSAGVADSFRRSAARVEEIAKAIRAAEDDTSALPDYGDLTKQLSDALDVTHQNMAQIIAAVKRVEGISAPVAKSRKSVSEALAKADKAMGAMMKTLAGVADDKVKPDQAAAVLQAFAKAAPPATEELRLAADALRLAAGDEYADVIRQSEYFAMNMRVPLPDGSTATSREDLVTNIEQIMAPRLDELVRASGEIVKQLQPAAQLENLKGVASIADHWAKQYAQILIRAELALEGLANPDKETAAVFKQVAAGTMFKTLIDPMKAMLATAKGLPEIKGVLSPTVVTEKNIVIIEVGDKTEVATFDEVFPKQLRLSDRGPGQAGGERAFNGDAAIASKMLKMGRGPFGTVIVAFYDPPQQMMGRNRPMPRAPLPIPPTSLGELTKAMEAGNFTVVQWNMANPEARPNLDPEEKKVLLVLPPPPASPFGAMMGQPSPTFGPEQMAQLTGEIDAGTPAIFLSTYLPTRMASMGMGAPPMPIPPNTEVHTYLEKTWGVEIVREARVIVGNPDDSRPGYYKINVEAFTYLPISTFSDHPIGEPLQGQRVFWMDACPIRQVATAKAPIDVEITPLLTITSNLTNVWATRVEIGQLVEAIRAGQGLIKPDYDDALGDVAAPMDLAVYAERKPDEGTGRPKGRIMVTTVGAAMQDWYVTRPIGVSDGKGGFSFDEPPRINTTLVVNSLYWMTDRADYIAAGPGSNKTMGTIDEDDEVVLKAMSLAGFPLAVLLVGAVVMFFRKR